MQWVATVFDSTGAATTKLGKTPEEALLNARTFFLHQSITYRPYDGVIFVEGKPSGVVYRSMHDPTPCPSCKNGQYAETD